MVADASTKLLRLIGLHLRKCVRKNKLVGQSCQGGHTLRQLIRWHAYGFESFQRFAM